MRGVAIWKSLSRDLGLHMMDMRQIARSTMRQYVTTIECDSRGCIEVPIFELRGAVRFAGAELLARTITKELGRPGEGDEETGRITELPAVIFSLRSTVSLSQVAQRIISDTVCRLRADGKDVVVVDPSKLLHVDDTAPEEHPVLVAAVDEALRHVGGGGYKTVSNQDA